MRGCVCGLRMMVVVGGVGGISSESQSRWCRFEWVFSVSARPGFIQQSPPSPGDSSSSLFPLPPLRIPLLRLFISSSPPLRPLPSIPIPGPDCKHLYARGTEMARRQTTNRGQSLDRRWNGRSYSARYRNDASSSSSSHVGHHTAEVEGLGVGWEKKTRLSDCSYIKQRCGAARCDAADRFQTSLSHFSANHKHTYTLISITPRFVFHYVSIM